MSNVQNSALAALTKLLDDELAAEGITPDLLDYVMLEVEYSPVIPYRGGGLESAVAVKPYGFFPDDAVPDRFEVPGVDGVVDQAGLKIMRVRYLLAKQAHFQPMIDRFFNGHED